MNFKDVKEGDKIYIVNEGTDFGIRLETHEIKSIVEKERINNVTKEKYITKYFYLDDGTSFTVDLEFYYDDTNIGFIFADKVKAQKFFLKKEQDIYCDLIKKAKNALKTYNECIELMNNISMQRDKIEQDLILNGYNLEI